MVHIKKKIFFKVQGIRRTLNMNWLIKNIKELLLINVGVIMGILIMFKERVIIFRK